VCESTAFSKRNPGSQVAEVCQLAFGALEEKKRVNVESTLYV
jgi:hypothetical protein